MVGISLASSKGCDSREGTVNPTGRINTDFNVNLTQLGITWDEGLNEGFSPSGWPVGVSMNNCLD